jgi:membrane protease YdiL (CAAX protease family)
MRRGVVRARPAAGQTALVLLAACILLLSPVEPPRSQIPLAAAIAVGLPAGAVLFAALARTRRPPPVDLALAVAAPILVTRAAAEEVVWRRGLLLALAPVLGSGGAVAASSGAFALAHGLRQSVRELTIRAGLGTAFALLYLATGRLIGAITAHAVYNALAVAAARSWGSAAA